MRRSALLPGANRVEPSWAVLKEDGNTLELESGREADFARLEAFDEGRGDFLRDQASNASADAVMGAPREGDMARQPAIEAEFVGVAEESFVAVRGRNPNKYRVAFSDLDVRDFDRLSTDSHDE